MKLLLAVTENGFSFVNQAQALAKGLEKLNIETKAIIINDSSPFEKVLAGFNPDKIVAIGSVRDYLTLVERPLALGFTVIPWFVSEDKIEQRYIDALNRLPLILTPSSHCREIFIRDGVRSPSIEVLPEAVDSDFWAPLSKEKLKVFLEFIAIKNPLNISADVDLLKIYSSGTPLMFTTGGDATSKGAQEVLQALGKLDPKIPWIYIIKTWPSVKSLQYSLEELKLAQELGIINRIRYIIGEFSQEFMRGLMNSCHIYVAPSRSEGFGLPFVEAQLCGKPVVSLKATSIHETVIDGQTGFLADPNSAMIPPQADIKSLASYLQMLLTDKQLRERMGRNARKHAKAKYSTSVIAQKMLTFIQV